MDFNNQITPQTVNNETSGIQTPQSSTLRRCIRSKCTWITFAILIILVIIIPTTMILTKKQNPQETSTTTLKTTSTTTEGTNMLMNTTGIPLPLITQIPNCNLKDSRTTIAYYFSEKRPFITYELEECNNCPAMAYVEEGKTAFSPEWSMMWLEYNFFIKNSIGQDCEKNPIKGYMLDCTLECFIDATCVAFSREKIMGDGGITGECWLKTNITINQTPDDPYWDTIILNAKS